MASRGSTSGPAPGVNSTPGASAGSNADASSPATSVDDVVAALAAHDYLADEGLATSIYLALTLQRPLFLEGEAGVGKTEGAKTLARWLGAELIRGKARKKRYAR